MRIYLAGAAATGKTTTAKLYSKLYGAAWYEVEAKQCWLLDGDRRQQCFLETFTEIISRGGVGIYSNHLLTVYAYSKALGADAVAERALAAAMRQLKNGALVVILRASPEAIRSRLLRRLTYSRDRRLNLVEDHIALHVHAQGLLEEVAVKHLLPIVDTTRLSPLEVAARVRIVASRAHEEYVIAAGGH